MLVGEPGVLLPRSLLTVRRPFTRVGDGQRRGEHEHFADATLDVGLQDHPADARVERQLREAASDVGDRAAVIEGAEFLQQLHPVADAALVRRVEEREALHLSELQRGHLQDDRGEVGPQDLGVGVARPRREIVLGVQPDAHARRGAPRATGPLRGRGLRYRLDRQPLHLGPAAVPRDARGAGVDDIADTWHRQRRLGDVGGEHDSPAGVRCEDALLLGRRQPRVQRQHLGVIADNAAQSFTQCHGFPAHPKGTPAHRPAARPPVRRSHR